VKKVLIVWLLTFASVWAMLAILIATCSAYDGYYTSLSINVGSRPAQMYDSGQRCVNGLSVYWYAEIPHGSEYSISVKPKDYTRYGVGIAVDGRNTLTGERIGGDVRRRSAWSRVYVMTAERNTVSGWRENSQTIRRFVATSSSNSLANVVWGDGSQTGFIIAAVFAEHQPSQQPRVWGRGPSGTGAGDRVYNPTRTVEFQSEPVACEVYVIYYTTPEYLRGQFQRARWPYAANDGVGMGTLPRTVP